MRNTSRWALTLLAVALVGACGKAENKAAAGKAAAPSTTPLAATIKGERDHATLARVIEDAGLTTALDGVGPYTLLAPPDGVLSGVTDKAEGAALVRAHLLPGAVTRADISAALDKASAKRVQMRTMAGGLITFTKDGEQIMAAAEDGASARLSGKEELVSNGVLQPVDGLLGKSGG